MLGKNNKWGVIMAMSELYKYAKKGSDLYLTCRRGHFATHHSHTNYYIDITMQKSSLNEAKAVAKALLPAYKMSTVVDTILCFDGSDVIGTCLGDMLTKRDYASVNSDRNINILSPEYNMDKQMIFRDNNISMIQGKNVLVLSASVVTGKTVLSAIEAVNFYGGNVVGICSVFSTMTECGGVGVKSVFASSDLPDYLSTSSVNCPMCRRKERIDAVINAHGCSKL